MTAAISVASVLSGREPDQVIDLADLGSSLLDWSDEAVDQLVEVVQGAWLVVVACPTYKASFTGLLKLFLDRFPSGSLNGVLAIPLMLGGSETHALAPEVHLRPVLSELGATCPGRGMFLLDSHYEDLLPLRAELDRLREYLRPSGRGASQG
jgi:FMN reductase